MPSEQHSDQQDQPNPLKMERIFLKGPWVLAPTRCSTRRKEFFQRANSTLGFYATITAFSKTGHENWGAAADQREIAPGTQMTVAFAPDRTFHANRRVFERLFAKAGGHLANFAYLMVYGNFEAYLAEMVHDRFCELDVPDPMDQAINLLMRKEWPGKVDAIAQRLGLSLGNSIRTAKFAGVSMGFLGSKCTDPLDFLQKAALVRHRIVHYFARADAKMAADYPNAGLAPGKPMSLPFHLPFDLHFFFAHLTELIDDVFCAHFGWARAQARPECLLDI